jgi:hypothetical protein
MEPLMPRLAFVLVLFAAASPLAAQSLTTLLPQITFPDPVVTPATKDCGQVSAQVCQLQE